MLLENGVQRKNDKSVVIIIIIITCPYVHTDRVAFKKPRRTDVCK